MQKSACKNGDQFNKLNKNSISYNISSEISKEPE